MILDSCNKKYASALKEKNIFSLIFNKNIYFCKVKYYYGFTRNAYKKCLCA